MNTARQPFKATHIAAFHDLEPFEEFEGDPTRIPVMVDGTNAFTQAEWDSGRPTPRISFDPSRTQWCYLGGYKAVILTPLPAATTSSR